MVFDILLLALRNEGEQLEMVNEERIEKHNTIS